MISRHAEPALREAIADTPVILLHGPRQCGKSTLAEAVAGSAGRTVVTLDDPIALSLAKSDPRGFLATYPGPLLIDEIQRAPELFLPIKRETDRARTPGRFLLTGSANLLALPKLADSLAGRMEIIDLHPFSQAEREGTPGRFLEAAFAGDSFAGEAFAAPPIAPADLADRLVRGGFPEPSQREAVHRRAAWFESYLRTMLDRDAKDLAQIEALAQLPRLLRLVAERQGQPMNVNSLSADTGIPYSSLQRYLALLERLFLLQRVPAWSAEPGGKLAKSAKLFLVDPGLACHLIGVGADRLAKDPPALAGPLRGLVANELHKLAGPTRAFQITHLRTLRRLQVDFLVEARDGRMLAINLKVGALPTPADAEPLEFVRELVGDRFVGGLLLTTLGVAEPLGPSLRAVPISAMWAG